MAQRLVACPICPPDIECEHDQDDRRVLWAEKGMEPEIEPDRQYSAADQRAVQKRKNKQQAADQRADDDLCWLMEQEAGRRIMFRLLARCGVYHDCAESEGAVMARFLGRRSIGLETMADLLRVAAEDYLRMLKEQDAETFLANAG